MFRSSCPAKRYAFYLEVRWNSRLPPNEVVKYEIIALGDPAWRYTLKRATIVAPRELDYAPDVLYAFGRYCTKSEYRALKAAAKRATARKCRRTQRTQWASCNHNASDAFSLSGWGDLHAARR